MEPTKGASVGFDTPFTLEQLHEQLLEVEMMAFVFL